jgi:type III restriction enzyme
VTVGAINKKDVNNLYKDSEKTGGEKPIDLIRATLPIVIVDEPQSVDGGLTGAGKQALDAMNPLCTLRYSATHVDRHHMAFRLDAVDAYERKLVKQIEVASLTVESGHNKPYVKLFSVDNRKGIKAKVELDVQKSGRTDRKAVWVRANADLQQETARELYANYMIGEISTRGIELRGPGVDAWLEPGQSFGGVDDDALKRLMIRRTIEEHLEKQLRLNERGIKVLSLFFIDAVQHYRSYAVDGAPVKGKYALMFEEEYARAVARPKYRRLFPEGTPAPDPAAVHDGYFSIDKKGVWTDTAESNQAGRDSAERAYNLIMKEKERLLGFETPLQFIFSHSALREGWDNPNVFQICTLREIGTERERRQTIGRGLRLCVNQQGERVRGHEVNTLTVIATESYESFAEHLQKEIEADTGIRFGVVEKHQFAGIAAPAAGGGVELLGAERSEALWSHLEEQGYIDHRGKIQDALRVQLKAGTLKLPDIFKSHEPQVVAMLTRLAGKLEIRNADERRTIAPRRAVLQSPDFRALWDRVKYRTTYRVQFDNEALLRDCAKAIREGPSIPQTRVQVRKADLAIGKGGIQATETAASAPVVLEERDIVLPDILTVLQDATQLTRKSLARILVDSGRLDDFARNPQPFIELATEAINRTKRLALVDGIRYQRLGDSEYYAQELFEQEELIGYLKNTVQSTKSPYDYVVYDSETVERPFAEDLERNEAVKLYAKLPPWFRVPTPLGTYNPDWAVLIEKDGAERLYFVVETKGSLYKDDLRSAERARIECGRAHFRALTVGERPAEYLVARSVEDLMASV